MWRLEPAWPAPSEHRTNGRHRGPSSFATVSGRELSVLESKALAAMISVIVPAHNEEVAIQRCLSTLLEGAPAANLSMEILVVCNGCTDRTAEVARGFGRPVKVLVTARASKPHALNMGDAAARGFPRVYLDADIELGFDDLRGLTACLSKPGVLAATARRTLDLSDASSMVRSHYRARSRAPYPSHLVGRGIYALSEEGRQRFGEFPALIGDDLFVQSQFDVEECGLADAVVTVRPPSNLRRLLQVQSRVAAGTLEYRRKFPSNKQAGSLGQLVRAHAAPTTWPDLALYVGVVALARMKGRLMLRSGGGPKWESLRPEHSSSQPVSDPDPNSRMGH